MWLVVVFVSCLDNSFFLAFTNKGSIVLSVLANGLWVLDSFTAVSSLLLLYHFPQLRFSPSSHPCCQLGSRGVQDAGCCFCEGVAVYMFPKSLVVDAVKVPVPATVKAAAKSTMGIKGQRESVAGGPREAPSLGQSTCQADLASSLQENALIDAQQEEPQGNCQSSVTEASHRASATLIHCRGAMSQASEAM